MPQVQLATRIDSRVKRAIETMCEEHGFKIGCFVENALIDKLEELADAEDIKKLRRESNRPISEVIHDLGLDDEI